MFAFFLYQCYDQIKQAEVILDFLFEKLDVYQRAVEFANSVYSLCGSFPRGLYSLSDQSRRAATSISLNIAEGSGRFHCNDKKQFYFISRGSIYECVPLLEICKEQNLLNIQEYQNLKEKLIIISKMLSKMIQYLEKQ